MLREPGLIIHEEGPPMGMMEDLGEAQAEADRWNSKGTRVCHGGQPILVLWG